MEIFCKHCQKKVGQIADEKIPVGKRASVKCPLCGEKIHFMREESSASSPKASATPAVSGRTAAKKAPPPKPAQSGSPDYDFEIMAVIKEAWQKTNGVKGPLWGAAFIVCAIVIFISFMMGMVLGLFGADLESSAIGAALQLTLTVAMYPFLAGIMMIGIRRSVDLPVSYKLAFGYFSYLLPIVIAAFLVSVLTTIGFILLILPGIYLSLAYLLAIPLIVDKGMGPWEAMETSRKAIHKHWFKVFGLYFVMGLIYLISMIPLGLGIIWTMPMFVVVGGILYREIFGVSESK